MPQNSCSVASCEKVGRIVSGFCASHYAYWKRTGTIPTQPIKGKQKPVCVIGGCRRSTKGGGLDMCGAHYQRHRIRGDAGTADIVERIANPDPTCSLEACTRPTRSLNLCDMHYKRQWKGNDPTQEIRS